MNARGQSAVEVLATIIVLMIVYAGIAGLVNTQKNTSFETMQGQQQFAYCSTVAEKMNLALDQQIPELTLQAEFDTTFQSHNVMVGSSICPYRGNLNFVDCPAVSDPPNSFTKSAGDMFKIKFSPGKCNPVDSFDLYIPNSATCHNGAREEGEECEVSGDCPAGNTCNSCVCIAAAPSCFGAGTPISTPTGSTPIEQLRPGDAVLAFDKEKIVTSHVVDVKRSTQLSYFIIRADGAEWHVTAEHPMLSNGQKFVEVQFLKAGDVLWKNTGTAMQAIPIESITRVDEPIVVYNLFLEEPHTFFANGMGAHNPTGMKGVPAVGGGEKQIGQMDQGQVV